LKELMLFTLDACGGIWLQSSLRLVVEMNLLPISCLWTVKHLKFRSSCFKERISN